MDARGVALGIRTFVFEVAVLEPLVHSFNKVVQATDNLWYVREQGMAGYSCATLTPLDGLENRRLKRGREARVQGARLLPLALHGLKVVESALASHFALELLEAVEGHACGIGPAQALVTADDTG